MNRVREVLTNTVVCAIVCLWRRSAKVFFLYYTPKVFTPPLPLIRGLKTTGTTAPKKNRQAQNACLHTDIRRDNFYNAMASITISISPI